MSCYTGECKPGEKCVWGCALWDHWDKRRQQAAEIAAEDGDRQESDHA